MIGKKGAIEIPLVLLAVVVFGILAFVLPEGGITGGATYDVEANFSGGLGDCGSLVNDSSFLNGDIGPCPGDGLVVNNNSIVIDCQGHKIFPDPILGGNFGINNNGFDNVTVKNCEIYNFDKGIYYYGTEDGTIYNNTVYNNTDGSSPGSGITLMYTNNTLVENNTAYYNNYSGIGLEHSDNNTVVFNTANNNTVLTLTVGIYLGQSDYNNVSFNFAPYNYYSGIHLDLSDFNDVIENNASDNDQRAISMYDSDNNNFRRNRAINSWNLYGFYVWFNSDGNTFDDNFVDNNTDDGIFVNQSNGNFFFDNNITNNGDYGIELNGSNSNKIYNNYFDNFQTGFFGTNYYNAYDDSTNNWNTTYNCTGVSKIGLNCSGGNFWSDYAGGDYDLDGIGDTEIPYNSSDDIANPGDYLPLAYPACPFNLTHSYTLPRDLLTSGGGCINITADNVVLDCANYSISGDNLYGIGVFAYGQDNISVNNCNITRFLVGLEFNNTNNSFLINNTIYGNTGAGTDLHLFDSKNLSITDSRIDSYHFIRGGFSVENSNYGKVRYYNSSINANLGGISDPLVGGPFSYQQNVFVFANNSVFVNSTKDSNFNQSAELSFYNITSTDPQPLVDFDDDGSFDVCSSSVCTEISYSGGIYVYNVTHFTTYSSNETPTPPPPPAPNLTITKNDSSNPVNNGTEFNYTITINNTGDGNATNITLTETYPGNVTFVSASPPANASNNTWNLGNLTNGSSTVIYITVLVNASAANNSNLTNLANVSYYNSTGGLLLSSDTETTAVNVPAAPSPPPPPSSGGGGGGGRTKYQCNDNKDNDADGKIDYPDDMGCSSPYDDNESDNICFQSWVCGDWSECVDNKKTRSCVDQNDCRTRFNAGEADFVVELGKPLEEMACGVVPQPVEPEPECREVADCAAGYSCVDNQCVLIPVERKPSPIVVTLFILEILLVVIVLGTAGTVRLMSVVAGKKMDRLIAESMILIEQKNIPELHVRYNKLLKLYRHLRHHEKVSYYRKILELHNRIKNIPI